MNKIKKISIKIIKENNNNNNIQDKNKKINNIIKIKSNLVKIDNIKDNKKDHKILMNLK